MGDSLSLARAVRVLGRLPDFVKAASQEELEGHDVPPALSADRRGRYPTHTKAATWASAARFFEDVHEGRVPVKVAKQIRRRLYEAAHEHGLVAALGELEEKLAADFRRAALTEMTGWGAPRSPEAWPLRSEAEIQTAAEWLQKEAHALPPQARQDLADRILAAAEQQGVDLGPKGERLEKIACRGVTTREQVLAAVQKRMGAAGPRSRVQAPLTKLAEVVRRLPMRELLRPQTRQKIAAVLSRVDERLGRRLHWHLEQLPEEELTAVPQSQLEKQASDLVALTSGPVYSLDQISRLRVRDLAEFDPELARGLSRDGLHLDAQKAAEVLPTLPRSDAEELDRFLRGLGLEPLTKTASAPQQLSEEELRVWAGRNTTDTSRT